MMQRIAVEHGYQIMHDEGIYLKRLKFQKFRDLPDRCRPWLLDKRSRRRRRRHLLPS